MQRVFRLAPSPTGFLHIGHAYSALCNAERARAAGGRLLLRIEDVDLGRSRPEFVAAIEEDLGWLGFSWERPVRRQSEHFGDYREAWARLEALNCLYPCFCQRSGIAKAAAQKPDWPRDPDGSPLYPGTCRRLPAGEAERRLLAGEPAARRLDMDRALTFLERPLTWMEMGNGESVTTIPADPKAWGDAVVIRKDSPASYTLAVVVDDALQGMTDVVRGRDLFAATGLQRLLQVLLGLPEPRYHHHALLLDSDGRKLSKTDRSTSLRSLRAAGMSAETVLTRAQKWALAGRSPKTLR